MIWLNGQLVPAAEASVSVLDRGLLYGDGLFETMCVRLPVGKRTQGHVFRLDAHLERLAAGCAELSIELPFPPDQLAEAVQATVEANSLGEASVRLTVTRGVGGKRLDAGEEQAPTVIIRAAACAGYPPETYERGLRVLLAKGRRNERSPTSRLKTLNCLDSVLARLEARRAGADDALWLNTSGQLACLTAANLFVALGPEVYTPPVSCGVLPGITRQCVLELLAAEGVTVRQQGLAANAQGLGMGGESIPWQEVSELLATNSLMGVAPVVEVERRPVGSGRPGPLARRLRQMYELVLRGDRESG